MLALLACTILDTLRPSLLRPYVCPPLIHPCMHLCLTNDLFVIPILCPLSFRFGPQQHSSSNSGCTLPVQSASERKQSCFLHLHFFIPKFMIFIAFHFRLLPIERRTGI